jgi:hypothetical protein
MSQTITTGTAPLIPVGGYQRSGEQRDANNREDSGAIHAIIPVGSLGAKKTRLNDRREGGIKL